MRLSTKSRYGLKIMCELAFGDKELYSVADLAVTVGTTVSYLEQLMPLLRKAELVKSIRGAGGGYSLGKNAENITIGEILRALEDELEFVDCISGECENKCTCKSHYVWKKIYDAINKSVDEIMLIDLSKGDIYE